MEQPDIFSLIPEKSSVLTVNELLEMINDVLQPMNVTVRGEVSSMQERPTGIYFAISDKVEKAKLECVLFRRNSDYYKSFIKEGAEIEITGHPNVYKPFGKLSFIADQVTPVGEGALKAAFEALKRQLQEEGYFDEKRKRKLPPFIHKIGLITSEFGDARKDFVTHLGNYGLQIRFHDARVEGANAIPTIVNAIDWFNIHEPDIEVIVLTRGGGSLESLQAFNSLEVAQAVFSSRIPVISAVGHENDVTIADMVADVRASTPTHAGKILSESWMMAGERVESIDRWITSEFQSAAHKVRNTFEQLQLRMLSSFSHILERKKSGLTMMSGNMLSHFRAVFTRFEKLEQSMHHAQQLMQQKADSSCKLVDTYEKVLFSNFAKHIQTARQTVETYDRIIAAADPHERLKQGYSMTTKDGRIVKNSNQLQPGEEIVTSFAHGKVSSKVTTIDS